MIFNKSTVLLMMFFICGIQGAGQSLAPANSSLMRFSNRVREHVSTSKTDSDLFDPFRLAQIGGIFDIRADGSKAEAVSQVNKPPLLVTESDSTRVIALDSVTSKGEPFSATTLTPWSEAADWWQRRIFLF